MILRRVKSISDKFIIVSSLDCDNGSFLISAVCVLAALCAAERALAVRGAGGRKRHNKKLIIRISVFALDRRRARAAASHAKLVPETVFLAFCCLFYIVVSERGNASLFNLHTLNADIFRNACGVTRGCGAVLCRSCGESMCCGNGFFAYYLSARITYNSSVTGFAAACGAFDDVRICMIAGISVGFCRNFVIRLSLCATDLFYASCCTVEEYHSVSTLILYGKLDLKSRTVHIYIVCNA